MRDFSGTAVAIDGDTLVVGAEGESSSATTVNGDQQQRESLGCRVCLSAIWHRLVAGGSGDTLVVTAQQESSSAIGFDGDQNNDNADKAGAIYLFR